MDIQEMDQGLLKRNPSMTPGEFSNHWLTKHAPLVVPFFLDMGVAHYEQIHGPLHPISPTPPTELKTLVSSCDGVAGMPDQASIDAFPGPMAPWKLAYYQEVILVDESKFLVTEALKHVHRVPPQTVRGETKVIIEEGKVLIDVPESVWGVWREYQAKGIPNKPE